MNVPKAESTARRPKQRRLISVNNVQNGGVFQALGLPSKPAMDTHSPYKQTNSVFPDLELLCKSSTMASLHAPEKVIYDERAESGKARSRVLRHEIGTLKPTAAALESASPDSECSSDGLSDFIVSDSASESELRRPPRSMRRSKHNPLGRTPRRRRNIILDDSDEESLSKVDKNSKPMDEVFQDLSINVSPMAKQKFLANTTTDDQALPNQDGDPMLALPLLHTPPTSPSRPKLQSPTKSRTCIPHSPHRQSIDAFWNQGFTNDWNEVYSPQKTQKINKIIDLEHDNSSPLKSPQRMLTYSPRKDKSAVEKKVLFNGRKQSLAEEFLIELDESITRGQLAALSASTGGVRIVWSKTLNSTAGRAKWQREAVRITETTSTSASTKMSYNHSACIELAEKVIDNEDRLLNVLAHEFCHLANFMVSNVKDQPHGKSFKEWAAKVTSKFSHKNIRVTTKHSYAIDYKYIWGCIECGIEYKRHSKSIDPVRHTCGTCKGKLLQIKPVPRGVKTPSNAPKKFNGNNPYQVFVKVQYAVVKAEHPEWKMKEVMSELARRYRDQKANRASKHGSETREIDGLGGHNGEAVILTSDNEEDAVDGSLRKLDEEMTALTLD